MITRRRFLESTAALGATAILPSIPALAAPRVPRTLREKVEQLFVISFKGKTAGPDILSMLQRHAFGGVILFERNCGTAAQIRTLLSTLQSVSRFPLLVGTDQEGGIVVRIRHAAPVFPSEATYGQIGNPHRVYHDAMVTAQTLRALGLTMNLAPVVDVLSNPRSPIGSRSYGPNAQIDALLSSAAIRGYQHHGLAAVAKHFIGLGHASIDSHEALPTVRISQAHLEKKDMVPFRAAVKAGVSSILVAHVALPLIDPVARPASLSPVIIQGLIRKGLGFNGVVMTDSLLMGALPAGHEPEAAELAFMAGADILLFAINVDIPDAVIEEAVTRVTAAVARGRVSEQRLDASVARVLALKKRYPPLRLPGTPG